MQTELKTDFVEEKNLDNHFAVRYGLERVLFSKQSPFQKVEVVQTRGFGRMLLNDDLVMVTERDEFVYHEMIAHVPLFTHPHPKRVLIIGGGDGGTAREVLRHTTVEHCDMVEIDSVVVEACREFIPQTAVGMQPNPRFALHIEDGVAYVKNHAADGGRPRYDVIIVDSTDPIGPAQPLFGEDFYRDVFQCLNEDGLVVSQGESPFYNQETQSSMVRVLSQMFPIVQYYNFSNLTYPGGYWSFSFGSKKWHPVRDFHSEKVSRSKFSFQYYNEGVHQAAFQLPTFQKNILGPHIKDGSR